MDYRVALDIYKGPLDLLLYLIQESEVDVTDIPIAKITEQYLRHLDVIHSLDPNLAGEFLVMASTLMEIKSRMLLPKPEKVEGQEDEGDPRIELIRQLMEYKKFKEAAAALADLREEHLDRFGRGSKQTFGEASDAEAVDLSEVSIWDILSAFDRIMRETMRSSPTTIVNRDVPLKQHIETLLRMLRVQGMVTFRSVFETCEDRLEAIGSLLAILEMTRWRVISLEQTASHGTILVKLVGEQNVEKLMNALSAHPDMTAAPMEAVAAQTAPVEAEPEPAPSPNMGTVPSEEEKQEERSPFSEPDDSDKLSRYEPDEEDLDEDLDRIRKIEVRDIDLSLERAQDKQEEETDAKPSDAGAAPQADAHQPAVAEAEGEGQSAGRNLAEDEVAAEPLVSEAAAAEAVAPSAENTEDDEFADNEDDEDDDADDDDEDDEDEAEEEDETEETP